VPCPSACEDSPLTPRPDDLADRHLTETAAWQLLLELSQTLRFEESERTRGVPLAHSTPFTDLYLPLCEPVGKRPRILAHLGQSIDGYIATASGDSDFVNDRENIRHLHRLRALHDAVIVGAGTIAADDPQLTTRLVPGPNPLRVVLDPARRTVPTARVFTDDAAPTIVVVATNAGGTPSHGQAEVLFVPTRDGVFDLAELVDRLAARGLRKLFVEGGGTTVSRFFDAGLIDRLQIAVAPVLTGRGKPGLRLAANDKLADCPRPQHRVFAMGQDVLFDCVLGADAQSSDTGLGDGVLIPASDRQAPAADWPSPIRRIR
jgi:diaminohydroxyphosphoribosylaminopyrimidine deaminase/5-amino-6-(5-phosphoribosylamino)uracil reductase